MIIPVILAGGSGTRLWPLSRSKFPKQFINLVDEEWSLFQQTVSRAMSVAGAVNPIVVCNEENRFMVAEQLRQLGVEATSIILEPEGKNTAPAVALAALEADKRGMNGCLLVLPSDHAIKNIAEFSTSVSEAEKLASQGKLVTFGVKPTRAETGYGYILQGEVLSGDHAFKVAKFVEKPSETVAQEYLDHGGYVWNSGMFAFGAKAYLDELKAHREDIYTVVMDAIETETSDLDFTRISKDVFSQCPSDSIDYAVMEKTQNAAVVRLESDWSDLGAWDAIWDLQDKDENDNVLIGDVISHNTNNCFVRADNKLVATIGINNAIIVETDDALLVANKDEAQAVKDVVGVLKSQGRVEKDFHTRVYRPWGWYESICNAERFQVKRIMVKPGEQLSLQMHYHRAEHWIVVSGTAQVVRGEDLIVLTEDESTYIPLGTKHRLINPGKIPLVLIEVQSGGYLGEDDIVRFNDDYGRV